MALLFLMNNARGDAPAALVLTAVASSQVGGHPYYNNGDKLQLTLSHLDHWQEGQPWEWNIDGAFANRVVNYSTLFNRSPRPEGLMLDADMNHIHEKDCPVQLCQFSGGQNQVWSTVVHKLHGDTFLEIQLAYNNKALEAVADGSHNRIVVNDFTGSPGQLWNMKYHEGN